jgi:hypothetical protein
MSMKLKHTLIALVSTIAPFLTLLPPLISPATAQEQSACFSEIQGQERGSPVNIRSRPGTEFSRLSYVLVGQRVMFLSDTSIGGFSRSRDSYGITWYYVEDEQSRTRGWIREDFLGSPNCTP